MQKNWQMVVVEEANLPSRIRDYTINGGRRRFKIYDYSQCAGQTIRVAPKHGSWTFVAGATQDESLKNRREAEKAYTREKLWKCGVKRSADEMKQADLGIDKHADDMMMLIKAYNDALFRKMMKKQSDAIEEMEMHLDNPLDEEDALNAPFQGLKMT